MVLCAIIFSQEEEYKRLGKSMIYFASNNANCTEFQYTVKELKWNILTIGMNGGWKSLVQ